MAAPYVAGAAMLLRNAFPNATNAQVVRCLISGSSQPPRLPEPAWVLGGGMLNVRAAYDCLARNMSQPLPFNCRTQTQVPPCVDALSGKQSATVVEASRCCIF
jgi:hypothetical protein